VKFFRLAPIHQIEFISGGDKTLRVAKADGTRRTVVGTTGLLLWSDTGSPPVLSGIVRPGHPAKS